MGCCVQAEYKKALDTAFIRATGPARILNYKQKVRVTMSAAQHLVLPMLKQNPWPQFRCIAADVKHVNA